MINNFVNDCASGEASIEDINDYINAWYISSSIIPIHMYLGLTWDEYNDYIKDPSSLYNIVYGNR
jgi:hypothetical protein